jgi:glutamyl-tRNA synthetase
LSKRKDPEADVNVLIEQWYPAEAIKIYLMSLINSKFEDRRREQNTNSEKFISYHDFPINFENCNTAWAIFDLVKLNSICADYFSMINLEDLIHQLNQFYNTTSQQKIPAFESESTYDTLISILWFDRNKKLHTTYQDILNYIEPLLADNLEINESIFPDFITKEKRQELILLYNNSLSKYFDEDGILQISKEERRESTKSFASEHWFASNKKEFIEWTHAWLVSDFAMILRVYLYGKTQTPDIYNMITIYGKEKTSSRLLTSS